jgi:hypothetical protein
MQDVKDSFTDIGHFPGHKTGATQPQDRDDGVRNSGQLKLILATGHSD